MGKLRLMLMDSRGKIAFSPGTAWRDAGMQKVVNTKMEHNDDKQDKCKLVKSHY